MAFSSSPSTRGRFLPTGCFHNLICSVTVACDTIQEKQEYEMLLFNFRNTLSVRGHDVYLNLISVILQFLLHKFVLSLLQHAFLCKKSLTISETEYKKLTRHNRNKTSDQYKHTSVALSIWRRSSASRRLMHSVTSAVGFSQRVILAAR